MKNILLIEIKDNKTIATLTKVIEGKSNLLMQKTYNSRPLLPSVVYDTSIIGKIRSDLKKMNFLKNIDESALMINTKRVLIKTNMFECETNKNYEYEKQRIKDNLKNKHASLKMMNILFSNYEYFFETKKIKVTVEYAERTFIDTIVALFAKEKIFFDKKISVLDAIEKSMFNYQILDGVTFAFLVEEKFTQLTAIENGMITFSEKWSTGLIDIYNYIKKEMNITLNSSKKLFKSFGSIPPEDVVDNKVLHTNKVNNELEIFTKKDLSRYITEIVNESFANIKKSYDETISQDKKTRLVFSGEITSLQGFKKYARKSFSENDVKEFESGIIGLNEETEFITLGAIKSINKNSFTYIHPKNKTHKTNLINRFIKMYNYI